MLPECERLGLAYLPYFPLASGLLTGKYTRGEAPPEGTRMQRWGDRASGALTDRNFDVVEAVSAWAAERDHSILDVAIAWLLAKPVVASVIAGATKVEQVRANADAGQWRLSPGDVADVDALAPDPSEPEVRPRAGRAASGRSDRSSVAPLTLHRGSTSDGAGPLAHPPQHQDRSHRWPPGRTPPGWPGRPAPGRRPTTGTRRRRHSTRHGSAVSLAAGSGPAPIETGSNRATIGCLGRLARPTGAAGRGRGQGDEDAGDGQPHSEEAHEQKSQSDPHLS